MDRYFYTALLLSGISSFGCLTVAIAKEQVFLESANSTLNDSKAINSQLDNSQLDNSQPLLNSYSLDSASAMDINSHQELQAITHEPLVTAVLQGKLQAVVPMVLTTEVQALQLAVSNKTMMIVKEFEGFRASAYLDTDGTPVIGYGQSRINGKKVRLGDRISAEAAEIALEKELQLIQTEILETVAVNINEHQLGALSSLAFNTGIHALKGSTLIKKLNQQNYLGAANEFPRWNKANIKGKLVRMEGLSRRRHREKQLFLTPVTNL